MADFPALWESLEQEERREVLRLLVEELKVYKTHAEMKLLFLDPVQFPLVGKTTKKTEEAVAAKGVAASETLTHGVSRKLCLEETF